MSTWCVGSTSRLKLSTGWSTDAADVTHNHACAVDRCTSQYDCAVFCTIAVCDLDVVQVYIAVTKEPELPGDKCDVFIKGLSSTHITVVLTVIHDHVLNVIDRDASVDSGCELQEDMRQRGPCAALLIARLEELNLASKLCGKLFRPRRRNNEAVEPTQHNVLDLGLLRNEAFDLCENARTP